MHALVYHVPMFIKTLNNFRQFTGQGTEKKMMMLRRYIFKIQISGMLFGMFFFWNTGKRP